jgi:predicted protein tyrosine phosphatase
MNILFVCSANKDRSRTAEDYFAKTYSEFSFDSAGTNKTICRKLGTTYISIDQLKKADKIFVMELKHLLAIENTFGDIYNKKITVLNVKDIYKYGSTKLIEVLKRKISL